MLYVSISENSYVLVTLTLTLTLTKLDAFNIEQQFKPLLAHEGEFKLNNYSYLLPYLATQMHTAFTTA